MKELSDRAKLDPHHLPCNRLFMPVQRIFEQHVMRQRNPLSKRSCRWAFEVSLGFACMRFVCVCVCDLCSLAF
jgi:hypothetical protein